MEQRLRRAVAFFVSLLLIACAGEGAAGVSTSTGNEVCSSFPQFLPSYLQPASPYVFEVHPDSNCDGQPERGCVVFYHFAAPASGTGLSHSPVGAVYYQSGCQGPGCIQYGQFLTTDRDYLCENRCVPSEEDVLSQASGNELVVRDIGAEATTRLTVFQWVTEVQTCTTGMLNISGVYAQAAHFVADRIAVQRDRVELDSRLPSGHPAARSQVALRRVLVPRNAPGAGWQWSVVEEGHVFYYGLPADVTHSLYPEAVVLGLYTQYTDTQLIQNYFTPSGWTLLNGCDAGQCGCALPRAQVARIQATLIACREWTISEVGCQAQCASPNRAIVEANVICAGAGRTEPLTLVRWTLVYQGDRWLLDGCSSSAPRPGTEAPSISPLLFASIPPYAPTPVPLPQPASTSSPQFTPLAPSSMECPMDAYGNFPAGTSQEQIDYCMSLHPNP